MGTKKTGDYQKFKDGSESGPKPKKERFNDAQFVNYELDKTAQAACKAWDLSESAALQCVMDLVDRGYSVTLKYDDYSDAYTAFLRPGIGAKENVGLILTGRGSSPYKALKQVLFKHYEVMAETWEFFVGAGRDLEIDD